MFDLLLGFGVGYLIANKNTDEIVLAKNKPKKVIHKPKPIIKMSKNEMRSEIEKLNNNSKECETTHTTIWVDQNNMATCSGKLLTGNQKTRIIYKKGKGK